MGRVEGKVVAITGAARGQGRNHALRLAEEGADIIAIDLKHDISVTEYALSSSTDLEETARLVEKLGRRISVKYADVRDYAAVRAAIGEGVEELGALHALIPNAGILPIGPDRPVSAFTGVLDVNLTGTLNTVHAAIPHLEPGGSIIIVGSIAGFMPPGAAEDMAGGPGYVGYKLAKKLLIEYVKEISVQLAPIGTRVNAIHPTNVDTEMVFNPAMYRTFRPDLENPTKEDIEPIFASIQGMPIAYITSDDVSHAVIYLVSDESRYVTGTHLRIDGGALAKLHL
jgi:SDR family mycofactocin-dependent oxidoreductase